MHLHGWKLTTWTHQTKLFVSFDAPQRGANIPLSLQELIITHGFQLGFVNPAVGLTYWLLFTPNVTQMLTHHAWQIPCDNSGIITPTSEHTTF